MWGGGKVGGNVRRWEGVKVGRWECGKVRNGEGS